MFFLRGQVVPELLSNGDLECMPWIPPCGGMTVVVGYQVCVVTVRNINRTPNSSSSRMRGSTGDAANFDLSK